MMITLTLTSVEMIVHVFVTSRLDDGNAILYRLPAAVCAEVIG